MNSSNSIAWIKAHKKIVLIVVLFFLPLLLAILTPVQTGRVTPTPAPAPSTTPFSTDITIQPTMDTSTQDAFAEYEDLDQPLETKPNLVRINTEANGIKTYYFSTDVKDRLNMTITKGEGVLLTRMVIPKQTPTTLADVVTLNGKAERILKGSKFYGPNALIYIYGRNGTAYVINSLTNEVTEKYLFYPTTPDDFIKRFGEDFTQK